MNTIGITLNSLINAHSARDRLALLSMVDGGLIRVVSASQALGIVGNKLFMTAWHGTPHDLAKFDMSKVGTGNGAQAYGHGLYFAGTREIGEYYRSTVTAIKNEMAPLLEEIFPGRHFTTRERVEIYHSVNGDDPVGAAGRRLQYRKDSLRELDAHKLDKLIGLVRETGKGKLYQVDLKPDEKDYLSWEKPLREQSKKVQTALASWVKKQGGWIERDGRGELASNVSGKAIYQKIASEIRSDAAASEYLHSTGIRGIRYLDGVSRDAGDGSFNYVIFDDSDIEITAKYSRDYVHGADGEALAFFNQDDGVTYFVADHIPDDFSAEEWRGLVRHEIGVHALGLGREDAEFKNILNDLEVMRVEGVEDVVKAYGRVPQSTLPEFVSEEALGYLVQEKPELDIVGRTLSWFKGAVRALGQTVPFLGRSTIGKWADKLSVSDLQDMASGALQGRVGQIAKVRQQDSDLVPMFSRAATLDPYSKAAELLLRKHIGIGFSPGPDFPGDTIRKGFDKLYKLGFLKDDHLGRMVVTPAGKEFIDHNHLIIGSKDRGKVNVQVNDVVKTGRYSGQVMDIVDGVVTQKINRNGDVVRHAEGSLSGKVKKDDVVHIEYQGGVGVVKVKDVEITR